MAVSAHDRTGVVCPRKCSSRAASTRTETRQKKGGVFVGADNDASELLLRVHMGPPWDGKRGVVQGCLRVSI